MQGSEGTDQGAWLHTVQLLPIVVTSKYSERARRDVANSLQFGGGYVFVCLFTFIYFTSHSLIYLPIYFTSLIKFV